MMTIIILYEDTILIEYSPIHIGTTVRYTVVYHINKFEETAINVKYQATVTQSQQQSS